MSKTINPVLSPDASRDQDRLKPFFGPKYLEEYAARRERGSVFDRLVTLQLGSTAVGPMARHNTSLETLTLLKVSFLAKKFPEAVRRIKRERAERNLWQAYATRVIEAAEGNPAFTVLQIGAFDGISNDRLHPLLMKHGWHAFLVEPLEDNFQRLRENYEGQQNVSFVRAAISEVEGEVTMSRYDPVDADLPHYIQMMSTIHPERVFAQFPHFQGASVTEKVPAHTLSSLVSSIGTPQIDFMFVDAEGCDYEIMQQLFSTPELRPQFLVFEHDHMTDDEFAGVRTMLADNGYDFNVLVHDVAAIRR